MVENLARVRQKLSLFQFKLNPTRANSSQVGCQKIPNFIKVANFNWLELGGPFGQGFTQKVTNNDNLGSFHVPNSDVPPWIFSEKF